MNGACDVEGCIRHYQSTIKEIGQDTPTGSKNGPIDQVVVFRRDDDSEFDARLRPGIEMPNDLTIGTQVLVHTNISKILSVEKFNI